MKNWYVRIPNEIAEMKISLSAKGLFLYVAAKPATWHFCAARIGAEIGCGERTIKTARRELEAAGLLVKKRVRNSDWSFGSFFYVLPSVRNAPVENAPVENAPVRKSPEHPKTDISEDSNNPKTYIKPSATKKRKEAKPQRTFSEIRKLIAEKDAETNAEKEKENERAELRRKWQNLAAGGVFDAVKVSEAAQRITNAEKPDLSPAFRRPLIIAHENKIRRLIIEAAEAGNDAAEYKGEIFRLTAAGKKI